MAAFKTTLTSVRQYTEFDPIHYTTFNRPISDLKDRDDEISDELDDRITVMDVTLGVGPTINRGPVGWTITRVGTGEYTITHNMNLTSTDYSIFTTLIDSTPGVATATPSTNTLTLRVFDMSSAPKDCRVSLLISK